MFHSQNSCLEYNFYLELEIVNVPLKLMDDQSLNDISMPSLLCILCSIFKVVIHLQEGDTVFSYNNYFLLFFM